MALLGFLAVIWCVADALLGLTIPPAETVSVPALVGLSEDAAGAYAFLDVTAVYRNDDSPAGTILAQEPVAGSRRKLSGGQLPVRLTVSLGRAEAQIPALAGEDAKAAAGALRVLGFTVKTVRLPGGIPETVDRTEPPAGESAAVGTVVTLFVCAGESVRTVAVPNLIGMTRGEAILTALLLPNEKLKELQDNGEFTKLLALQEENKLLPVGAVWDEFCTRNNVPAGSEWFKDIEDYEKNVQLLRK